MDQDLETATKAWQARKRGGSDFDRAAHAEKVRAKCALEPPVVPGLYDRQKFLLAVAQWKCAPRELTDEDLEQLNLVCEDLGERARAARAGFVETPTKNGLATLPVSFLVMKEFVEGHIEVVDIAGATTKRLCRETRVRVDQLERDQQLNLRTEEATVKDLNHRIAALERELFRK